MTTELSNEIILILLPPPSVEGKIAARAEKGPPKNGLGIYGSNRGRQEGKIRRQEMRIPLNRLLISFDSTLENR